MNEVKVKLCDECVAKLLAKAGGRLSLEEVVQAAVYAVALHDRLDAFIDGWAAGAERDRALYKVIMDGGAG